MIGRYALTLHKFRAASFAPNDLPTDQSQVDSAVSWLLSPLACSTMAEKRPSLSVTATRMNCNPGI